jgi:hypothetical protein
MQYKPVNRSAQGLLTGSIFEAKAVTRTQAWRNLAWAQDYLIMALE